MQRMSELCAAQKHLTCVMPVRTPRWWSEAQRLSLELLPPCWTLAELCSAFFLADRQMRKKFAHLSMLLHCLQAEDKA